MVITEKKRGDKMEQQERAAGKTYPGHKSSPFFFFLISLSLTHYYVFSPTKLTKYVSSRRDVKKKKQEGGDYRGGDAIISSRGF
jgi:hypothetical protein